MSIHPSLRSQSAGGALRSVLKRHERVRRLMDKGDWEEGRSMFGLPKLKQVKVKAHKAEAKEEKAAETAVGMTAEAKPAEGSAPGP